MIKAYSPFDASKEATILSSIKTEEIILGYKKIYNIDVSANFKNLEFVYICECPLTSLKFYFPFHLDGDANFYKQFSLNDWYYNTERWEHITVAALINAGTSVLEIGSGDGVFYEKLTATKKINYVGLELNPLAIEKAKAKGIRLTNETLNQHAQTNLEKYDVVCSFQVMEHISAIHSAMSDSLKVLKKGGLLIIAVPNNETGFIKSNLHPSKYLNMPPHHVNLFDEKSLLGLGNLFQLKRVKMMTETLQENHMDVFIYYKLSKLFFGNSLLTKLAWRSGIQALLKPFVRNSKNRITGHTIIAIFEK